jgi:anti-sigma regulatory factor (Ser/Thr protein kinase)
VRDGKASFLVDGAGVMLGVTGGTDPVESSTPLEDGDFLVLYTDGLVERRGENLADGLARLAVAASALDVTDPEDLCDALLSAVLPETTRDDDVAKREVGVGGATVRDVNRLELPGSIEAAATARGFVAGVLERDPSGVVIDTAVLLVSELVTNAIRHGSPPCALVISMRDDGVQLAVQDADSTIPSLQQPDALAENGRGLVLVDALSDDWGIRPVTGGKETWFFLRSPV